MDNLERYTLDATGGTHIDAYLEYRRIVGACMSRSVPCRTHVPMAHGPWPRAARRLPELGAAHARVREAQTDADAETARRSGFSIAASGFPMVIVLRTTSGEGGREGTTCPARCVVRTTDSGELWRLNALQTVGASFDSQCLNGAALAVPPGCAPLATGDDDGGVPMTEQEFALYKQKMVPLRMANRWVCP